ncbi:MAG: hypothetical protein ABTQ34_00535 [Bdellovibrionales bacterium]
MQVTFCLPDEQVAALREQAAAHGFTLEEWCQRLAMQDAQINPHMSVITAINRILEIQTRVKPDPDGLNVRDYINRDRP